MLSEAKKLNFTISQMEEIEPKLLHARLSRYLAENEFGVTDPVVLSAIEHHTLGRPNMSLLEKIIYLADHAECGRDYAEAQTIRELAKSNLDKALALSTAQTLKYLNARQSPIDQRTVETHKFYSKEK
jgi:predicted HD superfamily hydrolase involved in NAD metabolism